MFSIPSAQDALAGDVSQRDALCSVALARPLVKGALAGSECGVSAVHGPGVLGVCGRFAKAQVRQLQQAPLAQSAERLHGKEKVYGSIP